MVTRPSWETEDLELWQQWWMATPKDTLASMQDRPVQGQSMSEPAAFTLAMVEALRGTGNVSPNPLVGSVIRSHDQKYLGSGGHLQVGQAHAEINAMAGLSPEQLKGARVVVTLEPCSHYGRTPPCADRLASLGLSEVCYAVRDPYPRVNGSGAKRVADSGTPVIHQRDWEALCEDLGEVFLFTQRSNDVFVGLKAASTKDGMYATEGSSRLWITGQRSRDYGHYLRMRYDGILVGLNTVLLDDPALTVRHPDFKGRTPLRFVLDRDGTMFKSGRALKILTQEPEKTVVLVREGASVPHDSPVRTISVAVDSQGEFSWADIRKSVWSVGCRSLLIEGGAEVWHSALAAGTVQKIHWFVGADRESDGLRWKIPKLLSGLSPRFMLENDAYFEVSLSLNT